PGLRRRAQGHIRAVEIRSGRCRVTALADPPLTVDPPSLPARGRLKWWREVIYIAVFYGVYTAIRDTQGSASVSKAHAFHNAQRVIRDERVLHAFHEEAIQHAFLSAHWFVRAWDVFYGSAHFGVTALAMIWLFRRMPDRYALWRNTLAITTSLALVGFALYPLMP